MSSMVMKLCNRVPDAKPTPYPRCPHVDAGESLIAIPYLQVCFRPDCESQADEAFV